MPPKCLSNASQIQESEAKFPQPGVQSQVSVATIPKPSFHNQSNQASGWYVHHTDFLLLFVVGYCREATSFC